MTAARFLRTISFMSNTPANNQACESPSKKKAWVLFLAIVVGVAGLDLWSKAAVFDYLGVHSAGVPARIVDAGREVPVIPGFFDLQANFNYGAFNGWFSGHTGLLALLSCSALLVIASVLWYSLGRSPAPGTWFIVALGLLAGGTAGNFYDRFVLQAVRDWIKWYVVIDDKEHVWPNFNVADSGICVGVVLVIFLEIFQKEPPSATGPETEAVKAKTG